ncbi:MAG: hypothetical protein J0M02_18745 [Planctomycetes bacterium]|nr:hypothetical protein [Planctomycetota bacterium]
MTEPAAAPRPPSTSRLVLFMAGLAEPLSALATLAIALVLVVMGLAKFLGDMVAAPMVGADGAGPQLLVLATGGVIAAPWGIYLVGGLQLALGLGLLVPASRALAALGCLLAAAAVVVGGIIHRADLTAAGGLNPAGVALVALAVILLCGAAFGARGAAKRVGAAA